MRIDQANKRAIERNRTNDYYTVIDTVSGQTIGRIIDISPSGFKIISADNLGVTSYECLISFPRSIGNVRDIPIQVSLKWCEHNRRFDWYEAGFEFERISDHTRSILARVIEDITSRDLP